MEETLSSHDILLGAMIPTRPPKDKSRWSTEEFKGGNIRSVETLLAQSDRSSGSIDEANCPDEPRVQEPYEVALKV